MTRLIGGSHGGRRLRTPTGDRTRPTSDRVREALFSALEAELGSLDGARVLDLYAGSGALGLEALSRGAESAVLVESDRRTAGLIRRNADDTGLPATVEARAVERYLADADPVPAHAVLADPPYPLPDDDVVAVLALLVGRGWLEPDAVVVLERSARSPEPTWPGGLVRTRSKAYGETVLWWLAPDPGHDSGTMTP